MPRGRGHDAGQRRRPAGSRTSSAAKLSPNFRYNVDFYWPRHRVAAEADGEVRYSDPRRAVRQLERDQQLRDVGYKVIHFTWRELFQNPAAVIARIRKALAALSPV